MNTTRKFWLVLIGSVLGMAVIACSCNSLIPTPTPTPLPTATLPPLSTAISEPSPSLAGYWLDTDTNDVHTIAWQNGQYVVTEAQSLTDTLTVTSQSYANGVLTWTYDVLSTGVSVTLTTTSASSDSLDTTWSNTLGNSGTQTLQRVSSPVPPAKINQEPIPGLAGYWQDPENNDVHTIVWQNDQYVVTATNNPDHGSYQVTQQSWNGSALTWTYKVSNNNTSVTLTTVSVSGDSLDTNWTNSDGKSGTETLQRVSSPVPPQPVATMPLVLDSMAGRWNDPDTEGTVTTIIAVDGGGYAVQSVINPSRGANELTKTNWSNGVLTWTYCIPNGACYTSVTVSLSGDSLDTTWTDDAGSSGQTTFQRLP